MITTLSFTVFGKKRDVTASAALFMTRMGKTMGREINGVTLLELHRKDSSYSLPAFKRKQIRQMFSDRKKSR